MRGKNKLLMRRVVFVMPKRVNLVGQKFGMLTVVKESGKTKDSKVLWECLCKCGKSSRVTTSNLNSGRTKSCGCDGTNKGHALKDITGKMFGKLTVIEKATKSRNGFVVYWLCKCDCGKEAIINGSRLRNGKTRSCGCSAGLTKHGMSKKRPYVIWSDMIARCYNPNSNNYHRYGGRGIKVCDDWRVFDGFWKDMGPTYGEILSIERVDVNGNYEPNNCTWIPLSQQQKNTTANRKIEYKGKTQIITELAKEHNIRLDTLSRRLTRGWSIEKALTTPVNHPKTGSGRAV